jgi:hypothetical protein
MQRHFPQNPNQITQSLRNQGHVLFCGVGTTCFKQFPTPGKLLL